MVVDEEGRRAIAEVVGRALTLAHELRRSMSEAPETRHRPVVNEAQQLAEALGTLLWSIGMIERLRPHDRFLTADEALAALSDRSAETAVSIARLRTPDELASARALAEAWHWRFRTYLLQDESPPPSGSTWASLIAEVAEYHRIKSGLQVRESDFEVLGKPFNELSQLEIEQLMIVTLERHRAMNWLCGMGSSWDTVPVDT